MACSEVRPPALDDVSSDEENMDDVASVKEDNLSFDLVIISIEFREILNEVEYHSDTASQPSQPCQPCQPFASSCLTPRHRDAKKRSKIYDYNFFARVLRASKLVLEERKQKN